MSGLRQGFAFLKQNNYLEALHCFKSTLRRAKDPEVKKHCLYGMARAQIGLKNFDVANRILVNGINDYPDCDLFYSALTRFYESQKQYKEAETIYLKAVNNGCRSNKFLKQYEWFLLHYVPPVPMLPRFQAYAAAQLQQQAPRIPAQAVIPPIKGQFEPKGLG